MWHVGANESNLISTVVGITGTVFMIHSTNFFSAHELGYGYPQPEAAATTSGSSTSTTLFPDRRPSNLNPTNKPIRNPWAV